MKAPVVPDAVDGVLDLGRLSGGDVIVRLERYIGIRPGDIITVFFGTSLSSRVIVPYQLPFAGFFDAVFRKNDLLNGVYDVRYDVLDLAGNIGLSQASVVTVVGSPGAVLPAPVFPDAGNGVLASRAIAARGGAAMEASYTAMQAGDVVAFHWSGENALGRPVAAATWDGEPYTVDAADKALGRVATLVPKSFVLALGDGGRGAAFYTVVRRGSADAQKSLTASVAIVWKDLAILNIFATQGAMPRIAGYPDVWAADNVTVFGQPNSRVNLSVLGGTLESASASGSGLAAVLDARGLYRCRVFAEEDQSSPGVAVVSVYGSEYFQKPAAVEAGFSRLYVGTGGVHRYSFTENAIADGEDVCSLYLFAESGVDRLYLSLTGDALINGWQTSIALPLHADRSATVNIVSDVPGKKVVTIARAAGTADAQTITVNFLPAGVIYGTRPESAFRQKDA